MKSLHLLFLLLDAEQLQQSTEVILHLHVGSWQIPQDVSDAVKFFSHKELNTT